MCFKQNLLFAVVIVTNEPDYGKDTDEPDYGKEKLKSLSALTRELITGEAEYLQSLQCIVNVSHAHYL